MSSRRPPFETLPNVARLCAAVVVVIASTVLVGYVSDRARLISIQADWPGMSPLTAVALIGLAAAIGAASFKNKRWSALGAGIAAAAVAGPLISRLATGEDALSPHVARFLTQVPAGSSGSVSIGTAISELALSGSVVVRWRRPGLADFLGGMALLLSGVTMLGYLYGVQDLSRLAAFHAFALHTAVSIFLIAAAGLVLDPDSQWVQVVTTTSEAGRATRRKLAFTIVPPLVGLLLVTAVQAGRLGFAAAMAIFVGAIVVPLAVLVLRDGQKSLALDRARAQADELGVQHTRVLQESLARQATQIEAQAAERSKAEQAMHSSQRLESVGQLTGGIAHDFNNLLMVISGNLQLMRRRLDPAHPCFKNLQGAMEATAKGAKVTGQLLAFSRTQRLKIEPFSVSFALSNAGTMMRSALGSTVEIKLDVPGSDLWALGDTDQCELALMNLAVNARDAMTDGTGTISVSARAVSEVPSTGGDGVGYVRIRVKDNGAGMDPEVLKRAVEPFFTTKDRGKGTGLGLAQAYGFARQSQGDLRIASQLGEGTTVDILLPWTNSPAVDLPTASLRDGVGRERGEVVRRVLVIDDDDRVRDVIVEGLVDAGFEVHQASDGQSGIAALDRFLPDVAVIDFAMPGMNGAQTAQLARAKRPELPIVFVTGYSDTVALDGVGGATVLRKPFEIARLQQVVSELVA